LSRVAVIFTGGTISMRPDADAGGAVPVLRGQDILDRTAGLQRIAQVEPIDWGLVPASHLGFDQIIDLGRLLDSTLDAQDVDGAVVVQGTDTMEETAFAFDLLVRSDKPVVVTGAMRNSAEADYDGPRNLRDAVRVASSPQMRGLGTSVVMAGRIIAADRVVKRHTTALASFGARAGRLLGRVVDDRVTIRGSRRRVRLPGVPASAAEPVFLVTAVTGLDGGIVRSLKTLSPRGLVVAATGSGNTHPDLLAAATELIATGAAVCLSTRCQAGRVVPAYAFAGGGAQWQRAGAILSPLDGPKCRVALALGLGAGATESELRRLLRG
jgi:L-asparaginase